jgi:hypothetical protein
MSQLLTLLACLLVAALVATPFLATLHVQKVHAKIRLHRVLLVAVPICVLIAAGLAYLPEINKSLEIKSFEALGFNPDGFSRDERVVSLAPQLHEAAESAYWSKMGVGWPLRAGLVASAAALYAMIVVFIIKLLFSVRRKVMPSVTGPAAARNQHRE